MLVFVPNAIAIQEFQQAVNFPKLAAFIGKRNFFTILNHILTDSYAYHYE